VDHRCAAIVLFVVPPARATCSAPRARATETETARGGVAVEVFVADARRPSAARGARGAARGRAASDGMARGARARRRGAPRRRRVRRDSDAATAAKRRGAAAAKRTRGDVC
jgi:hypothetical protein